MHTMPAVEFAKSHSCDPDWVQAMADQGREAVVLSPGQRGTYSGFAATVVRHYANGMYEVRVPGGVTCISGESFVPA